MKKKLFILFLLTYILSYSQVSTSPSLPTANDLITITFDATNTPLSGVIGDVYAHTGVTVNGTRWQNVIGTWGDNLTQPKLTRDVTNPNLYTLQITPTVFTFYGVTTSATITELSFVFRSATASGVGATWIQTSPDIFVPIYAAGLNIAFTSPINQSAFNLNDVVTISAEASISSNLELFVNGISQVTATNSTTISTSYTVTTTGTYTLKAVATNGTDIKETFISIYVKTPTTTVTKPLGLKYGINKNPDNSVTFLLKAPQKTDVLILGDFNNWSLDAAYQMFQDGEDFWLTVTGLDVNAEFAYQYLIDYTIKIADPYSEKILDPWTDQYIKVGNYPNLKTYPTNLTTGYVSTFQINESIYSWNIANFTRPSQNNLIIYEMHIRDFVETDSYNEAITKLDYLKSLGINAIELLPVNEFEGADSWGYNPALYMALDKSYGTKNDFKKFVDECHLRGIAVIADVVFNHSYGQSPLVQMYWDSVNNKPAANNPWYNQDSNFIDNTNAHWGYDFNHTSAYTTNFFKDVLTYWMQEYKIDGFRFDFTKGFSNTSYFGVNNWGSAYDASRIAILKNYATHVWNQNIANKPYVIFEHLADNSEETELANYGILLWGNMNYNYNQNTMGYANGSDISWISYKNRGWNNANVVGYMESHDEERLMFRNLQSGNSSNTAHNVKNLKIALSREELAGLFFFTIPGPKMLWQFGELGYDISIETNGRVGRKPIHWEYFNDVNRKQIYNTWATLIEFKKQQPVFNSTDYTLNVSNLSKAIVLRDPSMDIVIVGNFDVTSKSIAPQFSKTGIWYEYFTGEEKNITNTTESILLNPGEYKLYSTVKLLDPRGGTAADDSDGDGVVDTVDLCPNTPSGVSVNATGCPIFTLSSSNFTIESIGETCTGKNNGQINITAQEAFNYSTTINGVPYSFTTSTSTPANLAPGNYTVCISVTGQTYEQCYLVTIPAGVSAKGTANIASNKATVEILEGTAPFKILINGIEQFETTNTAFSVNVKNGDVLEVQTSVACEGVFSKTIDLVEFITAYPNPTTGNVEIALPNTTQKEVTIELYTIQSQMISIKTYPIQFGKVQINIADKPNGLYIAKLNLDSPVTLKILKQ